MLDWPFKSHANVEQVEGADLTHFLVIPWAAGLVWSREPFPVGPAGRAALPFGPFEAVESILLELSVVDWIVL